MDILLIEDSESIISGLEYSFKINNYQIKSVRTIKEALLVLEKNRPKLIILDITLPDGSGMSFYEHILRKYEIPTIFLTARDSEEEIVKALNLGAEDYLTKPFFTKELLARVRKIILRNQNNAIIKVKDITFDLDKMEVYKKDRKVEVSSLELKILHLLFLNINKVVNREVIIDKLWEWTGNDVSDHTITVYISRLREKIGDEIIKTVKGIGYRIDEEE